MARACHQIIIQYKNYLEMTHHNDSLQRKKKNNSSWSYK